MSLEKQQYQTKGFALHSTPLLPPTLIQNAVEGMDAIRRGEYNRGRPPCPSPWNPGDDPNALCKIEQPQFADRAIWEIVSNPLIGALAAEITGATWVQAWWVQLLVKPPALPDTAPKTNVGWHQDRSYWGAWEEGSELFTAWVALSDVREESGPMRFVSGSHQWGLLNNSDFFAQDLEKQSTEIALPSGQDWQEVSAVLAPGGVSFHHCLTLHGSGPNRTTQPRRSLAIHLRTQNSRPANNRRQGLTEFIDQQDLCPVLYQR